MSLPRIFATTPATVPQPSPYIAAPRDIPAHLRLPDNGRLKIGFVWAGSPDNKIDRQRTIPARLLAPLARARDADIVSLQVGPRAEEAADLGPVAFACHGKVADFADSAAVLSQLDLVVGVDTAVMHLAAALGRPAWMLIPYMPDYRWLLARGDTPWYSAMRLFRQEKRGGWDGLIARVAGELTNWQPSPAKR